MPAATAAISMSDSATPAMYLQTVFLQNSIYMRPQYAVREQHISLKKMLSLIGFIIS